jgi:hypothetical protein
MVAKSVDKSVGKSVAAPKQTRAKRGISLDVSMLSPKFQHIYPSGLSGNAQIAEYFALVRGYEMGIEERMGGESADLLASILNKIDTIGQAVVLLVSRGNIDAGRTTSPPLLDDLIDQADMQSEKRAGKVRRALPDGLVQQDLDDMGEVCAEFTAQRYGPDGPDAAQVAEWVAEWAIKEIEISGKLPSRRESRDNAVVAYCDMQSERSASPAAAHFLRQQIEAEQALVSEGIEQ